MPETPTSIQFDVNTPVYLNNNPSATWEDLVKQCILPVFKEKISSHCVYKDYAYSQSATYPAISIPWHNDTIDGGLFIYINRNKSDTCGTIQAHPTLCVGDKEISMNYMARKSTGGSGAGSLSNYRMDQYKFTVRILYYTDFMALGIKDGNSDNCVINTNVIATTFKKGDETLNGVFKSNSSSDYGDVNIVLYNGSGGIERSVRPQGPRTVGVEGCGLAVPLYDGEVKSDYFYLMCGLYKSCRGPWSNIDTAMSLMFSDNNYSNNLFYKNAFVINGQSFDVFMGLSNTISDSNRYPMILRKHID